jgi:hypothetical protein
MIVSVALRGLQHLLFDPMITLMVTIPLIMLCKIIVSIEHVLTSSAHFHISLIISPVNLIVELPVIHVELGFLPFEMILIHCPDIDSIYGILTLNKVAKIAGELWMRHAIF